MEFAHKNFIVSKIIFVFFPSWVYGPWIYVFQAYLPKRPLPHTKTQFFQLFFLPSPLPFFLFPSLFLSFSHFFFFLTIYFTFDQLLNTSQSCSLSFLYAVSVTRSICGLHMSSQSWKPQCFLKNHLSLILTNNNRHNFKRVQDLGHNHLWCSRSLGATPDRRSSEGGDTQEIQAQFLIDKGRVAFHTCLRRLCTTAVRWFSVFRRKATSRCRLLCL